MAITEPATAPTKKTKTPKPPKQAKAPRQEKAPKTPKAPAAPAWGVPVKPSLNLLPEKSRGLKAKRRAARQATFMGLGMLGAAAAGYMIILAGVAGAQAELDKEHQVMEKAQAFLAENRDVQEYADGFIERKAAAAAVLDGDVSYAKVLQAIGDANTVGAEFTTIKTADLGTACASASPFAPTGSSGCLDLHGNARDMAAVSSLVDGLRKDKQHLTETYLTEAVAGEGRVTFRVTVGYTEEAHSGAGAKFEPSAEELATLQTPATDPALAATGAAQ